MWFRPAVLVLASASLLLAIDADRDFSGKWILDSGASDVRLSQPEENVLTIRQDPTEIRVAGRTSEWRFAFDGSDRKARVGAETRNSAVKWEGAALLINTIVTGPSDYVLMDRWRLSRDHNVLTVARQVVNGPRQEEGILTYRREGFTARPAEPPAPRAAAPPPPPPAREPEFPPATTPLSRREPPPPAGPAEYAIPAGTHLPLTFRNTVDTKHSKEGDRIYLATAFPVAQDGRVVIPRGSFVTGTITQVKQPGHMKSKGELSIRFDILTLPNGVIRDFRSRLASGDEGKTVGQSDPGADTRKVAGAAGTGATVGVITGGAAGHAGMGAGIGGAAAGLASILLSRGPDATLPQGTTVDMVLDRELRFRADELR